MNLNSGSLVNCRLYDDLSSHNNLQFTNEPEFRCYDILLNLCNGEMLRSISRIKPAVRNSEPVKFALRVHQAFTSNNFVKFFNLMKETTLLNACIMHRYFAMMRSAAFQLLRKAFTSANQRDELLPKIYVFDLLCFEEDDEFDEFCRQLEVEIDENDNVVLKRDNRQVYLPETYKSRRSIEYIDAKKGRKMLSEIIYNEKMNENPYRNYPLQNSFDENGLLKETEIHLDNKMIKIDQKTVYSFSETKNKQTQQDNLATTSNKFAILKDKTDKTSINFGPSTSIFGKQPIFYGQQQFAASTNQQTNNLFGKRQNLFGPSTIQPTTSSSLFTSSSTTTSSNLFGKNKENQLKSNDDIFPQSTPSNLFTSSSANSNLFGNKSKDNQMKNSTLFSQPTSNLFSKAIEQQKPNNNDLFQFKLPSDQQQTDLQSSSNLFSSSLKQQQQESVINESPQKPTLSDEELSSLSASILRELLNETLENIVRKCILNVSITNYSIELTNTVMNEAINESIHNLCKLVYTNEKIKLEELKKMINIITAETCDRLINDEVMRSVNSISRSIYMKEFNKFIQTKSEIIANSYFEEAFEQLVFNICCQTLQNEWRERERIIAFIKERRGWRLAGQYFRHWKKRCDYLKRYRFIRDTFPASRMENSPPVLKRVLSVPDMSISYEQPFKRKMTELNQSFNQNSISTHSVSVHFSPKLNQLFNLSQLVHWY